MRTAKVVVGSESSKGASMMMSKGTLMAEKTRQMKSDTGITGIKGLPPPLANPGVQGITAPKTVSPGPRAPKLGAGTSGAPLGTRSTVVEDDEDSDETKAMLNAHPMGGGIFGGPKNTGTTTIDINSEDPLDAELSPLPIERVDEHVYIGNKIGAEDIVYLKNNGITHIINTAAEVPNYHESTTGIRYFKLQLTDDPRPSVDNLLKILEPCYNFITSAVSSSGGRARVLVHCAAGVSRSASVVVYYLMKKNTMGFQKALAKLRTVRHWVNPNPWYCSQLQDAQTIIEHESGKLL